MTQEELLKKLYHDQDCNFRKGDGSKCSCYRLMDISLINQHVAEVIGEDIDSTEYYRAHKNDEGINIKLWKIDAVNAEHTEQRKRAGL